MDTGESLAIMPSMNNVCQDTKTSAARDAGQNEKWEVVNNDTRETLVITPGELKRHVCRLSRIEKIWKQVTVTDVTFRQIKVSRCE